MLRPASSDFSPTSSRGRQRKQGGWICPGVPLSFLQANQAGPSALRPPCRTTVHDSPQQSLLQWDRAAPILTLAQQQPMGHRVVHAPGHALHPAPIRSPVLGTDVQDTTDHASCTAQSDGKDYPTWQQHLPSQVPSCQWQLCRGRGQSLCQGQALHTVAFRWLRICLPSLTLSPTSCCNHVLTKPPHR